MTDKQILYFESINRHDIVNNNYKLNLSDEQISALSANACIAVIGSTFGGGGSVTSLRLFKSQSLAEKYIVYLLREKSPYAYVHATIEEVQQKMGKINNAINGLYCKDKEVITDIVINCLANATDVEEFYNQEIETIQYITDSNLEYSSALLYINELLYINTSKFYVHYDAAHNARRKHFPIDLNDKAASLNELAQKAYNESRGKLWLIQQK